MQGNIADNPVDDIGIPAVIPYSEGSFGKQAG